METFPGPVVVLGGDDCAVLGRQLVEAIRLGYVSRGRTPPRRLLEFADAVNRAGRGSVTAPAGSRPGAPACARNTPPAAGAAWWQQPESTLSVAQAAQAAGCSESYARRLCRKGAVYAVQAVPKGAWLVDAADFAGWLSKRRNGNDREAA